ncbi:MAG: hypothetical protein HFI26_00720 [Lachnospiraceae bacterium]|jgi:hypothetical protein|nr:hypothetical protein [Lachnospiraceae bacterium]
MKKVKWKQYVLILLCAALLCAEGTVNAMGKGSGMGEGTDKWRISGEEFLFEDKDIVGFIGDSITHVEYTQISYQEFLYNYYITRFPQRELEFRNLGTGSFTAEDVLKLYGGTEVYDAGLEGITKAVIMLGMNEALTGVDAKEYIGNIRALTELLEEKGLESTDIILVAPTPFDQTRTSNYQEDGQMNAHFDDLLTEYTSGLRILAEELGTYYIDLHTPLLWATTMVQKENGDATLTIDDSVHPSGIGNVLAGYFFLCQQGAEETVASVRISETGNVVTENAQVKSLKERGNRYVRFSYQPASLPMAVPLEVKAADQSFGMLDEISREILQVEGLDWDTIYEVHMDHVLVEKFTGAELAQGVNLASYDWNPGQMAAKDIEVLNQEWHKISANYRAVLREATREEKTATQEEIDAAYGKWEENSKELRTQMYEKAQSSVEKAYLVEIISEDAHVWRGQELWQWALEGAAALLLLSALVLVRRRRRKVK